MRNSLDEQACKAAAQNLFSELGYVVTNWARYYISFSRGALFISGLVFSHGLAENAVMRILISYFMEKRKNTNLRQAAAVVNVEEGISAIMAIIISYISDAYLCRFKVIAYTTAMFIIISEYWLKRIEKDYHNMNARPNSYNIVEKSTGCIDYQERNIEGRSIKLLSISEKVSYFFSSFSGPIYVVLGLLLLGVPTWLTPELEVRLFYPMVLLIAVGKAGRNPPLKAFLADQLTDTKQKQPIDEEHVEARKNFWWRVAWSLGVVASFGLFIGSWRWIVLTLSVVMGVAYLWFLLGIKFYSCKKPTGSLLTNVYKVFKAAILKRHLAYPNTANRYFKNDSNQLLLWPNVPFFRWLDKASIVESSSQLILEEQEITGRLCTVAQVKQVKSLLTIVPVWTTFVICGLVEATGRTFFIQQANNLDENIGSLFIVPVSLFITLKSLVSFIASFLLQLLIPKWLGKAKRQPFILVRIGFGMVFSIFSCIAAWQVEVHRLNLIKKETMSFFWLAPQFTLLGLMGGFAEEGLRDLFFNHVAEP
ncbi:protein NRT1/ PTR FAMILY 5.6-like [Durio zibethinus]|uniref:Protein NRT1/ PTR FAMILY 5.6-like n=1 Tax=Durio zibethinus TaxID=66656 RepID=A0A6P5YTZ6_DURZI|nr:protein NRT1/ PTR FAMILY 5.6-like [Durio zibethinus]